MINWRFYYKGCITYFSFTVHNNAYITCHTYTEITFSVGECLGQTKIVMIFLKQKTHLNILSVLHNLCLTELVTWI